jgi:hypothetical protein
MACGNICRNPQLPFNAEDAEENGEVAEQDTNILAFS